MEEGHPARPLRSPLARGSWSSTVPRSLDPTVQKKRSLEIKGYNENVNEKLPAAGPDRGRLIPATLRLDETMKNRGAAAVSISDLVMPGCAGFYLIRFAGR